MATPTRIAAQTRARKQRIRDLEQIIQSMHRSYNPGAGEFDIAAVIQSLHEEDNGDQYQMTSPTESEKQLKRLEVWVYTQRGRVFLIDKSLGNDNNLLNAVAEITLPDEATMRKEPDETHQQQKDRIVALKMPIAEAMVRAFQSTSG